MSKVEILRIQDYLERILQAIERIELYLEVTDEVVFLTTSKRKMR